VSQNDRYIVAVTRRRLSWLPHLLTYGEAGPFTYQKALTTALAARDYKPETFVKAVVYTAIKQVNGTGSIPGSIKLTLVRE
jgi:hypothetical protein